MEYTKPPLTFDAQAELLISRGMQGEKEFIASRLSAVNYYRLSGYWYSFKNTDNSFRPNTTFDKVWKQYVFDRRLRLLLMDAVGRIEIAVRTQLSKHHALAHGAFGYANKRASMPKCKIEDQRRLISNVRSEASRSREQFVTHFDNKYGDTHLDLPVWMLTEVISFGKLLSFYKGCPRSVKRKVADYFGMPDKVLVSWLLTLNTVRNICAHHGRLWNKVLGTKPLIPRQQDYPLWHEGITINRERVFAVLTICKYCLDIIAPQSSWSSRLVELLEQYPEMPMQSMGFPEGWQDSGIWREGNERNHTGKSVEE